MTAQLECPIECRDTLHEIFEDGVWQGRCVECMYVHDLDTSEYVMIREADFGKRTD